MYELVFPLCLTITEPLLTTTQFCEKKPLQYLSIQKILIVNSFPEKNCIPKVFNILSNSN